MIRYHGTPVGDLGKLPARRRLELLALLDDEIAAAADRHHGILATRAQAAPTVDRDPYARQHARTLVEATDTWRPPHDLGKPQPRTCPACRHVPQAAPVPIGA